MTAAMSERRLDMFMPPGSHLPCAAPAHSLCPIVLHAKLPCFLVFATRWMIALIRTPFQY